jgi:hypothetical protein
LISQNIRMDLSFARRPVLIKVFLMGMVILSVSILRPLLFAFWPIIAIIFLFLFHASSTKSTLLLVVTVFFVTILSSLYLGELNLSNNFLSLYFFLPLLMILLSRIKIADHDYFHFFIKVLTIILIFNNLVGSIQLIRNPSDDDSFNGFYGTHGLGLHTLSLVNYLVGAYYFIKYQQVKTKNNLVISVFFIVSAILSFYGLGLLVFLLTIFFYKFSIRKLITSVVLFVFVVVLFGTIVFLFKKKTFDYNVENIRRAGLFFQKDVNPQDVSLIPRKLLLYRNYVQGYSEDPGMFFIGSGPGTFNSRAYFLLNGDYSKSKLLEAVLGKHDPKLAAKYVHPLWNTENTVQYMDGTRNEPFSSVIALLAEYGFLVFMLFGIMVYSKYRAASKSASRDDQKKYLVKYLKFSSLFLLLNLFTDNFLEYPEMMMIYLLIFKLIEMSGNKTLKPALQQAPI